MQPNQQVQQQIDKNRRSEPKMESSKSVDGRQNHDLPSKKQITRKMVETGTELLHVRDGKVGNVAIGIGGTLVSPPLSVSQVEHYFGNIKGFPAITELVDIIKNGVPVKRQSLTSTQQKHCGMVVTTPW